MPDASKNYVGDRFGARAPALLQFTGPRNRATLAATVNRYTNVYPPHARGGFTSYSRDESRTSFKRSLRDVRETVRLRMPVDAELGERGRLRFLSS